MSAQAVPYGAFYVRNYTVARRVVFYYGDPDAAGGASVRCGAFDCVATNADEFDAWMAGPEGLAAVRESWKVVADFAREALALYEQYQNPPGQIPLPLRTPDDARNDPRPGDRYTYDGYRPDAYDEVLENRPDGRIRIRRYGLPGELPYDTDVRVSTWASGLAGSWKVEGGLVTAPEVGYVLQWTETGEYRAPGGRGGCDHTRTASKALVYESVEGLLLLNHDKVPDGYRVCKVPFRATALGEPQPEPEPERNVAVYPQPGDMVVDPVYPVWVEVRFATADRVYVNVSSEESPDTDFDAPLQRGPDGLYFSREIWGRVVDYVRV